MKFQTKEVKIALTAIVAAVLVFIGVNFLKGINIFQSSNTYYVKFKNVGGLVVSNPVYANGYPVGIVRGIQYDYQNSEKVVVQVELDDEMRVPQGTSAELETELMGGVKMNLILGANPTKHLEPGDTLTGGPSHGVMAQLGAAMPEVLALVPKLDSILVNLNRLTGDPALAHTFQNAESLTANPDQASPRPNTLMANDLPVTMGKLNRTLDNAERLTGNLAAIDVNSTMQSVNTTLADAEQFVNQLNGMTTDLNSKLTSKDNTLGLFLNDRGVYDNLNRTLPSADSLLIDLKAHPKRYVHFSVFGKKDK